MDKRECVPHGMTIQEYADTIHRRLPMAGLTYRESWALKQEIERLRSDVPAESCGWSEDDNGDWSTECGNTHECNYIDYDGNESFTEFKPEENNYRHCPYCGRMLRQEN